MSRGVTEDDLSSTRRELSRLQFAMSIDELASFLAHELTQPMAAVVANADSCLRWLAGARPNLYETRAALERIVRDATRASHMVRNVRIGEPASRRCTELLDLNDVIRTSLALARGSLSSAGIVLKQHLHDVPPVTGDRARLQFAVLAVLTNAVEAMQDMADGPRTLRVTTRPDALWQALVSIEDSGPAIDPQWLDRMFEPLFTTRPDRVGLGLAICRRVVRQHGGAVWARLNASRGLTVEMGFGPRRATGPGQDG